MAASSVVDVKESFLSEEFNIGKDDCFSALPVEILLTILKELTQLDIRSASLCNKTIYHVTRKYDIFKKMNVIKIFGPRAWMRYVSDPGEVPPLPPNIIEKLSEKDFLDPNFGSNYKNYTLTLIPKTINGAPLTPYSLVEAIRKKSISSAVEFNQFPEELRSSIQSNSKSHWVLFRKKSERSILKSDFTQVVSYFDILRKKIGISYRHPTVIEAVTCIFTWYCMTGERLYPYDTVTEKIDCWYYSETKSYFTYCAEHVKRFSEKKQIIVGGFSDGSVDFVRDKGLIINLPNYNGEKGVAAIVDLNP